MSPQEHRCLETIRRLSADGVSPSYDEIRLHLGLASKCGVHRLVSALVAKGHLVQIEGRARSLKVVGEIDDQSLACMSRANLLALRNKINARLRA